MIHPLLARFALVGGIILSLIGVFYTIGLFPQLGVASGRRMVDVIGLLALGILPLGLGLGAIWYGKSRLAQAKKTAKAQRDASLEQTIVQAIRSRPQGITAQDCAVLTPFSLSEVEAKLSDLHLDGRVEMEVTEQGHLVYKPNTLR